MNRTAQSMAPLKTGLVLLKKDITCSTGTYVVRPDRRLLRLKFNSSLSSSGDWSLKFPCARGFVPAEKYPSTAVLTSVPTIYMGWKGRFEPHGNV